MANGFRRQILIKIKDVFHGLELDSGDTLTARNGPQFDPFDSPSDLPLMHVFAGDETGHFGLHGDLPERNLVVKCYTVMELDDENLLLDAEDFVELIIRRVSSQSIGVIQFSAVETGFTVHAYGPINVTLLEGNRYSDETNVLGTYCEIMIPLVVGFVEGPST
jgi:hypothetical protein